MWNPRGHQHEDGRPPQHFLELETESQASLMPASTRKDNAIEMPTEVSIFTHAVSVQDWGNGHTVRRPFSIAPAALSAAHTTHRASGVQKKKRKKEQHCRLSLSTLNVMAVRSFDHPSRLQSAHDNNGRRAQRARASALQKQLCLADEVIARQLHEQMNPTRAAARNNSVKALPQIQSHENKGPRINDAAQARSWSSSDFIPWVSGDSSFQCLQDGCGGVKSSSLQPSGKQTLRIEHGVVVLTSSALLIKLSKDDRTTISHTGPAMVCIAGDAEWAAHANSFYRRLTDVSIAGYNPAAGGNVKRGHKFTSGGLGAHLHFAALRAGPSKITGRYQHQQEPLRIYSPWSYAPARVILESVWPFIDDVWKRMLLMAESHPSVRIATAHFANTAATYTTGGNHSCISPGSPFICGYLAQTLTDGLAHLDQTNSGLQWVVVIALYDQEAQGGEFWAQDPLSQGIVLVRMDIGSIVLIKAGAILHGALAVRTNAGVAWASDATPKRTVMVLWNPPAIVERRRLNPAHHELSEPGHKSRPAGFSLVSYPHLFISQGWPKWKTIPGTLFQCSEDKQRMKEELAARYGLQAHI